MGLGYRREVELAVALTLRTEETEELSGRADPIEPILSAVDHVDVAIRGDGNRVQNVKRLHDLQLQGPLQGSSDRRSAAIAAGTVVTPFTLDGDVSDRALGAPDMHAAAPNSIDVKTNAARPPGRFIGPLSASGYSAPEPVATAADR